MGGWLDVMCVLCGWAVPGNLTDVGGDGQRVYLELGVHLASEHPVQWEMAVQVVALQLRGASGLD